MLKDITLGQYFPGNSFIHKLDPRTKILIMIAYVVLVFIVQNFYGYLALAVFLGICVFVSKLSPKYLIKGLKPIMIFIVFTGLFNLFLTSGTPVWLVDIYHYQRGYTLCGVYGSEVDFSDFRHISINFDNFSDSADRRSRIPADPI